MTGRSWGVTIAVSTDVEREQVLRYWRAIELFSPQTLPRVDARSHVVDVRPGEPMPWEASSPLSMVPLAQGRVWRHEVYGGVYNLQRVVDTLVREFGDDDPADQRESARGQSALFGCIVDADGLLVDESAVLSSCAWALGRVDAGDRRTGGWLSGFDQDVLHFSSDLAKMTGKDFGGGVHLLAASMREALPAAVQEGVKAAVTGVLAPAGPLGAAGGAAAGSMAGSLTRTAMNRPRGAGPSSAGPAEPAGATPPPQIPVRLETHPLTGADVQQFAEELSKRLRVNGPLKPQNIRVRSYQLSEARASETPDSSFLNSFLANDLARVARALHREDIGPGLASYLGKSGSGTSHRVDVQRNPGAVRSGCQPERLPLGRWPANADHSLILSQQFAVNQAAEQLTSAAGLFAVNGPPGTGKTTMLRDLIAHIVVQRALRLAGMASPHEAFIGTRSYTWATSKMRHKVVAPRAELTGFEIVVASANNGAVENVTAEIPGPGGIGAQWRERAAELDYFTATAGLACGEGAWALVAARLGNRQNRGEFVQRFWWSNTGHDRRDGMADVLKQLASEQVNWAAEVARFTEAANTVRRMTEERQPAAAAIDRLSRADAERARELKSFHDAEATYRHTEQQLRDLEKPIADLEAARAQADAAYVQHRKDRPGVLVSLATRFRAGREWHAEQIALREKHENATGRCDQARRDAERLRGHLADARAAGERARDAINTLDQQVPGWRHEVDQAVAQWGAHVPIMPPSAAKTDAERVAMREKTAPWADEEFTAARTELFLAALRLHKAFLTATAPTIRRNLSAFMDLLNGRGPRPTAAAARAAWQTFFLMVPVVSSAFASVDRLFTGFRRESLGWLLIDEAGQATPQQAAGAIWRAKRTVVVGDPLQIEPVVTMPWGGQQALGRLYDVPEEWAPDRTSVQRIADQSARYGTWLPATMPDGSDKVWVGTPLRVHRRCDRPIFDLCNRIAYDGLMVYGILKREPFYGENRWYDVHSPDARGHWLPAEGRVLRKLLTKLKVAGVPASDIRVTSPFRQVVSGALEIHREVFPNDDGPRDKWVGTVHRMQGREADVVILVLGGQPDRPGARRWAAERPNLLNVAASRARRRLYVIGNRKEWASLPYFDALSEALPE
jgi:hypothetical protein